MADPGSPMFDDEAIFDSSDSNGNNVSEGCLTVLGYDKIRQRIHFNGEDGDRYLTHGWADRKWIFEGYFYQASYSDLASQLSAIEDYIDQADNAQSTYSSLTDSFGNEFTNAQIHSLNYLELPHVTIENGYVCRVRIEGIIQGSEHEG